jgi:hypothetical protein
MQNGKDTVYVDVDDEITTIIDKVTGSKQKIVALVLPKRAGVLQSIVNMKLLKRSADNAGKNVVLVTTEAALMPLAGAAGVHVAKTPLSKPEIPVNPVVHDNQAAVDEDEALQLDDEPSAAFTAQNAGNRPVGDLAKGAAAGAVVGAAPDAIETVELDDPPTVAKAAAASDPISKKAAAKSAKSKPPRIPDFGRFQKQILIAGMLMIVLIAGIIVSAIVLPKAAIAIDTDATDYNSSLDIVLDSAADKVSTGKNVVPATMQQQQKTYTQQVPATGQQNNGEKATGSITIGAGSCSANVPSDVPSGTGVSAGGQTYVTQEDTTFVPTVSKRTCTYQSTGATSIVAQKPGASYNLPAGTTFSVSGRSDLSASGSTKDGTDDIKKVVSQADITNATNQIKSEDTTSIKSALVQQLRQDNMYPVQATFGTGTPNVSSSANAGDAADSVTVTQAVTYTMYGAKRDYLDQLIKNDIKQQIDPQTQTILNDGLDSASVKSTGSTDTTNTINLATTATVGPNLDIDSLKEQVRGKKAGYVKSLIGNQPGVTNVTVKLSPFWVGSVPKKASKIKITVGKAAASDGGH